MVGAWSERRDRRGTGWRLLLALTTAMVAGCGGDGPIDPDDDDGGPDPEPLPGTWTSASVAPVGMADAGVTVHEGRIYVLGGSETDTTATARTYRYDPASDEWERLGDLPEPIIWPAAAVHDGRVLLVGGNASSNVLTISPRSAVRALDGTEWTLHSALPDLSASPEAVTMDDGLLVVETGSFPTPPRGAARLAPGSTEWERADGDLPPIPAQHVVGGGRVAWAIGTDQAAEYRDGGWGPPFQLPDGFLVGAWALDDRLYVLTRQATRASMRVRDAATNAWVALAAPEDGFERNATVTATAGGRLYLIGGREATPAGTFIRRVDVFTPPS